METSTAEIQKRTAALVAEGSSLATDLLVLQGISPMLVLGPFSADELFLWTGRLAGLYTERKVSAGDLALQDVGKLRKLIEVTREINANATEVAEREAWERHRKAWGDKVDQLLDSL
jgi:hypothetical protein